MPIQLNRSDFRAKANKSLRVHLSSTRWHKEEIEVGFTRTSAKQIPVRSHEQSGGIRLNDFSDCQELEQIGKKHLYIWIADARAVLADILVKAKCQMQGCSALADSESAILEHIKSRHIRSLTYAEYKARDSTLPLRIAICTAVPGCNYVARAYTLRDNLTDMMNDHRRAAKHSQIQYQELIDVAKIAARLPDLPLPNIQKCHICEQELDNPSEHDLDKHLRENHSPSTLYKLE